MAFNWYLNMEPISLEIAREHIAKMTDSNFLNEDQSPDEDNLIPDNEAFLVNFKLGFVAIMMISCFYESSLNTFLREKFGYDPDGKVIRGSEDLKLEALFKDNPTDIKAIKGSHQWRNWQRLKRVRNELIHYKNNSPEFMSSWPVLSEWKIGSEPIGYFFTKSNICALLNDVENLMEQIVSAIGMVISPFFMLFGADGRYGIGSYYCSREDAEYALKCGDED